nr:NADH dehydrogenase subunit 2 [Iracundus signifer]
MSPHICATLLIGVMLGTFLVATSSHWLLAWMGLEISTLAIIPMMAQHHHPRAVEAATKYFLVQAAGAAVLLFASTTNAWLTGQWDILQLAHPFPANLIIVALALKLGLAPLHSWLPEVLQGLDLTTGLLLSTWQKIAPIMLLVQVLPKDTTLLVAISVISMLVGGWGGLNQTQLRKVLAYSSIAHLGWMTIVSPFLPSLTILTLAVYILMTCSMFMILKMYKVLSIATLATTWTKTPALGALMSLVLLSLGGLPPLTGFMPKWLVMQELINQGLAPIATMAALAALLSLYFYLRLAYAITLTISPNVLTATPTWRLPASTTSLPLCIFMVHTLMLLPLTPTLVSLVTA